MDCSYCERRCSITEDSYGFCESYRIKDGKVVERFPHQYSAVLISHIESIPFYHFQPGSRTLVLSGAGCNFDCHYCSNAHVARSDLNDLLVLHLTPEQVVKSAKQAGCHNIAFAVNEPTVFLNSLLEVAAEASRQGLPIGILTNGYTTPDVTKEMARSFDFVNVSLKSISDKFYRSYVGVFSASVVMRNIEIFNRETHLEVSTPIIERLNDCEIPELSSFISHLGRDVPWHVFRLLPEYKMSDFSRPDIGAISSELEKARRKVPYLYFGNFVGSRWVSTNCQNCGELLVERTNVGGCFTKPISYNLLAGKCSACGSPGPIKGNSVGWNSREDLLCTQH